MTREPFDLTKTRFWTILHQAIKWTMIVASVCSTGCMVYAVIKRYCFKGNFYGSDEIIMLFAFWMYFMGASYGSFENSHLKADLLNVYIKNIRVKDGVTAFAELCTVVVNTIVLIWASRFFVTEITKWGLSTSLKIPLIIPKASIFFGFVLMEFYHVYYLQRDLRCYLRRGVFSEPRPGDYISQKAKDRYPGLDIPVKGAAENGQRGERA